MKALVLVAHGSRREASNEEVINLSRVIKQDMNKEYDVVQAGFLELAKPSIPDSIENCIKLVLFQYDNYGFSVPVVFRSKAQCEGNGHSLVECCNAAAGHHRVALRVSLSTPTDCVAYKRLPLVHLLPREWPLPARRALP